MYEENNVTYRVGIDWKDLIIKLILLILFVLLLVWLFPKADLTALNDTIYTTNMNTMKEAAKSYYTVDRLPSKVGDKTSMTLKEMIDNHMLVRFTDKDKNYCDESSSYVEVTKTSDNTYALKVQLNCGSQKDYIIDTIGCNSVCTGTNCVVNNYSNTTNNNNSSNIANNSNNYTSNNSNNDGYEYESGKPNTSTVDIKTGQDIYTTQTIYYQHKKAIVTNKTVYTCPEGYAQQGVKCVKQSTGATIPATPHYNPDQVLTTDAKINVGGTYTVYADYIKTKINTEYTCPSGYTLNGSYCVKYTDATETPGATTYTCPSGYTLSGTKCTKTYDATKNTGTGNYTCSTGTLSGTKCIITTSATANTTYTCPSGYTKNGSSCYKVYDASASTGAGKYSCPNGGTLSGTTCTKSSTSTYAATAKTTYSCPNGGTLSGSTCVKSSSSTYAATASTTYGSWVNGGTKYYTSSSQSYTGTTSKLVLQGAIAGATCGSPCGNKGVWYKYIYYTRSASTKYSCPNGGTLSGSTCTVTTNSNYAATPKTTYSCPNGGNLSGSTCTVTSNSSYAATYTPGATSYSCPNGGTLSGNKCTITTGATAKTTYTCPSGYTLNGSSCTKTVDATYNPGATTYSCPNGGTLSGTKCTITTNATPNTGATTYTCPAGYTKVGTKCELKINATANDIYSYTCPAGYTKTGEAEKTICSKEVKNNDTYYCEDADAKLEGTKCIKTIKGTINYYTCPDDSYVLNGSECTKKTVIEIDATVTTQQSTSYTYTWSTKSYLDGWTFTGKTKTVTNQYIAGQK